LISSSFSSSSKKSSSLSILDFWDSPLWNKNAAIRSATIAQVSTTDIPTVPIVKAGGVGEGEVVIGTSIDSSTGVGSGISSACTTVKSVSASICLSSNDFFSLFSESELIDSSTRGPNSSSLITSSNRVAGLY